MQAGMTKEFMQTGKQAKIIIDLAHVKCRQENDVLLPGISGHLDKG